MFFGGELFDTHSMWLTALTFLAFSLVASSIYCYNDIVDVDADRSHPVKCHRPIASGAISIRMGYTLMVLTFVLGIGVMLLLPPEVKSQVMAVVVFYYVLNLSYCSKLKQYAILDVCIVAFGFVLRILAGGFACELASVTLVCYIMYCVSPDVVERFDTPYLYLTFVFVLLGLLRYIQIAVVDKKSGDPTKIILRDHFSQIIVVAWILTFLVMIYVI